MNTYAQKLKDPRWQRKRLEVLERAQWSCQACLDSTSTLHVHHKHYIKGREPWEYDPDQLAVLCEGCHEQQHADKDLLIDVLSRLPIEGMKWIDREKAAFLIAGALGLENFPINTVEHQAWFNVGMQIQAMADEEIAAVQAKEVEKVD
jgi:hypothetical protein